MPVKFCVPLCNAMHAQVSEDDRFVRRTTPIAEADATIARTVYAHPFQVASLRRLCRAS